MTICEVIHVSRFLNILTFFFVAESYREAMSMPSAEFILRENFDRLTAATPLPLHHSE